METLRISLEGHPDPKSFVEGLRKKYPDDDVKIQLKGQQMEVSINPRVPLQLKTDISSFLIRESKEAIHG